MKPAEECASLAEVREAIDTIDRELLGLLGRRAGYVHAAARFKTDAASVRAPEVVTQLFTLLVDYFTRREQRVVDVLSTGQESGDA